MPESLRRVQELTGRSVEFEEMDILDQAALQRLFKKVGAGRQAGPVPRTRPLKLPLTLALPHSTALKPSSTLPGSRL
jgi:hypothetical protein